MVHHRTRNLRLKTHKMLLVTWQEPAWHSEWLYNRKYSIAGNFREYREIREIFLHANITICEIFLSRNCLRSKFAKFSCDTVFHSLFAPLMSRCVIIEYKSQASQQAHLVEIWWDSRDSTPSYNELVLVIPFAWLRWWIIIEIAFVMTGENKNKFYMEI